MKEKSVKQENLVDYIVDTEDSSHVCADEYILVESDSMTSLDNLQVSINKDSSDSVSDNQLRFDFDNMTLVDGKGNVIEKYDT